MYKFINYTDDYKNMIFDFDGTKITTTQEAYLTGTDDNPYFLASAEDEAGNTYQIKWTVRDDINIDEVDGYDEMVADWKQPSEIVKY